MTCSQASWRKRFPSMASAENSLHTSQKRLWVFLRCRQGSRRPRDFFRCQSRWAGRVWLTFRRLLTHETESEKTRHFYGLFARLQHCLFDDRRMKIESSILSSPEKGLATQRSELSSFMDDRCVQETTTKKQRGTIEGGGGGMGRAGV